MPETSIIITAQDRYSDAIKKMSDYTKRLNKDVDSLETSLMELGNQKTTLKIDADVALADLKAAEKQFKSTRDEADGLKLQLAQANYDNIKRNLNLVTKAAKDTETQLSKMGVSAKRSSNGGIAAKLSTISRSISTAGGLSLVSDLAHSAFNYGVGSVLGTSGGNIASNAVSTAISGVAIGNMVAPGIGGVIGGTVGLVGGTLSGIIQNESAKDDAFKSYVQEAVETQISSMDSTLTSGTAIAGSREQTRMAFAHRFGSDEAANAYLEQVKSMAMGTNYSYDEITGYSKSLLNSYDPEAVFGVLQTLSDASAGLDLGQSDVNALIKGLALMRTTGKATQEYLNYFSERGVDVYQALSNATGADKPQIAKMVSGGQISGETAAQALLDYINETFGGLSEKLAGTYDAMVDNLADTQAEIDAAMGEGYTSVRVASIGDQIEAYGGELGTALSEANKAIGAGRAALDNLADQYTQEALGAVLLGQGTTLDWSKENLAELDELSGKYQEAMAAYETGNTEAGAQVEAYLEEARALAEAQYDSSEAARTVADTELELIDAINANTSALGGWRAQYDQNQALSKGRMGSALLEAGTTGTLGFLGISERDLRPEATGLQRVPYNNFPALLHEGERVLTASEARNYHGGGATVNVSGNTFVVRQDSDVDAIAAAIAEKISLAQMAGVAQ